MTQTLEDRGRVESFSLLGGPLHELGIRLGLVRKGTNTIPLGLALGLVPWAVLLALAVLQGLTPQLFSLQSLGAHVRLLVAIPLFFLCETWVDPELGAFVSLAESSGVVPKEELPGLRAAVARTTMALDSWLPEAFLLVVALLLPWIAGPVGLVDAAAARASTSTATSGALAGVSYWFLMGCLALFRFLMFRWLWRLGLWWYFLWRVARLDLDLVPTHPDSVAGLGYLEVVHAHFTPLILALSAVSSAMVADGIAAGVTTIEGMSPSVAWILILDAVLFLGPLFLFTPKLWACRRRGLRDYMELASHYVTAFDRKWLNPGTPPEEGLLGSADIQSLADLSGSISVVRGMRWAPVSLRLFAALAASATLPVLPLLLLQYPVGDLLRRLLTSLIGL